MQVAGDGREHVDVLADALEARSVEEVGGADGLAHDVPFVRPAGCVGDALRLHEVPELRSDLARLGERLVQHKVSVAPPSVVAAGPPRRIDVEEGQMIAFRHEEPGRCE